MLKVAIIGLDTSHSIQFSKRMQAPDCPKDQRVPGLRAVTCLRFATPFQDKQGLDQRQKELEGWGVRVTEDFNEAVADCDAIMLEVNDPAYHLEYFKKVAALKKPVFLDKPLAGSLADSKAILKLAQRHKTRVWSSSSLRFLPALAEYAGQFSEIKRAHVYGALGSAPSGDSLVWYGVHTFEMLQQIMGMGAKTVQAVETKDSIVSLVDYGNGRQGVVEVICGSWAYGAMILGKIKDKPQAVSFVGDNTYGYRDLLRQVKAFFLGGKPPVTMAMTFEGQAMMLAARQSIKTRKPVPVAK